MWYNIKEGLRKAQSENYNDTYIVIILKRRFTLMAYKITDACISCGACASECPVSAISEGDTQYVIAADDCIACGACAGVCPVGAPVED